MALSRTILVVDDSETDQHSYRRILRDRNEYNLVAAQSAEAGLAAMADARPDLILLDYNLPDMDGLSFMSKVAGLSPTPVPVIMLTGDGNESLAVEAMKCGAVDYLVKHVDGRHLKLLPSVIENAIQKLDALKAKNAAEKALKESEESLRKSAERLQAHIENSPMAVVSWDKDFNVTQWAGEAEKMFGWSAAETLGKPIMHLHMIYEEDMPLVQETMVKLRKGARHVISSNRNVTKDGRIIHCDWYNTVLSNEDGTMASVMSQVLDVTERKRMEQELVVMNNQLKDEVAMRTSDLSALTAHIQKIAEMERASLARELHDELGSTLVGISMQIGRLSGKISDPDLSKDLSLIKEYLSSAVQVTRAVVNQLYPTVLDNYGLVAAIEWQANEFRKHSGIEVELVLPEEPIAIEHTFALAAYRITQECLTNIAKHAGAGKIHIEVKTGDRFLDLTVHDNGKGLPDEIRTGGHGIFGMIERARYLGGSMEIGSEEGKGTTAHLRLPLESAKPKNRRRVLMVDDHAIFRDAVRHLLENDTDDFSVSGEAGDGEAAVQMAISEEWDIVLLDISLPKINGLAALERIKAAKPDLPVIMLSTHPQSDYAEIAVAKGAACYIEKGETARLVEAMRRAILQHR